MDSLMPKLFFFLALVSISLGHVQTSRTPIEVESFMNDTVDDLKKFEYSHAGQEVESGFNCSDYTIEEYVILENGSLLLNGSDTVHDRGTYILKNGSARVCRDRESKDSGEDLGQKFSDEFLSCGKVLIEQDEYKILENDDVYIDIYSETYGPRDYYKTEKGVYICTPLFDEIKLNRSGNETHVGHLNKFSESFTYVTVAGLAISILCLLSHLVVFCEVSSVRNLPGCCLASLSLSLLLAYACFLAVTLLDTGSSCPGLGLCIYYFFLTSFFWMNAIAFDVWRSFRVVMRELRISSHRVPWRRFLLYSLYSWTLPALLALLVKFADSTELLSEEFRPSFGSEFCWFGQRKALMLFFALPLVVVMVLNAAFFLDVTWVISRASLRTSATHEDTLRRRFATFTRLALLMGLTWIVGLVAGTADQPFLWYLFIVLNSLQGLFIFAVFSCSSKVRGLFCTRYKGRNLKRGSTSVRTVSQISANV
ncbi:g-protein coupled receptor Mth2 [Caerostris extrusa]|uniref:G-protein coupled receptor Mth2 n=1 Tax=Caerostris extrusa TaxID=172846 RepID=A0AAV4P4P1_CAEEX|nr:g-protein coupled receptor Mth2 [Caerostris extrusa]